MNRLENALEEYSTDLRLQMTRIAKRQTPSKMPSTTPMTIENRRPSKADSQLSYKLSYSTSISVLQFLIRMHRQANDALLWFMFRFKNMKAVTEFV